MKKSRKIIACVSVILYMLVGRNVESDTYAFDKQTNMLNSAHEVILADIFGLWKRRYCVIKSYIREERASISDQKQVCAWSPLHWSQI